MDCKRAVSVSLQGQISINSFIFCCVPCCKTGQLRHENKEEEKLTSSISTPLACKLAMNFCRHKLNLCFFFNLEKEKSFSMLQKLLYTKTTAKKVHASKFHLRDVLLFSWSANSSLKLAMCMEIP